MARVRVLVIRAPGINCDEETVYAWQRAGAEVDLKHVNQIIESPAVIDDYQVVTFPGGFAYGDDIAAGVILAQQVTLHLAERLRRLVERGGGLLGICNGFQVLVKAGLLPGNGVASGAERQVTVTFNDSAKFEARWVRLEVCTDHSIFLRQGEHLEMPIEHAEGKVITRDRADLDRLAGSGQVAVRYVDAAGRTDVYPANPNGSLNGIAGLCDRTGRVLGLMPHPERHQEHTNHPLWTRRTPTGSPDGLKLFERAVEYWKA